MLRDEEGEPRSLEKFIEEEEVLEGDAGRPPCIIDDEEEPNVRIGC